jgi:hypothetical protein
MHLPWRGGGGTSLSLWSQCTLIMPGRAPSRSTLPLRVEVIRPSFKLIFKLIGSRQKHLGMWLISQTQVWRYYQKMIILMKAHCTVTFIVSTGAANVTNSPLMILTEMEFVAVLAMEITLSSTTIVSLQKVASLDPLKLQFDSEMHVLPSHHQ